LGLIFAFLLLVVTLIFILYLMKPVTLSFAVPQDEFRHWSPLMEQFNAKYKDQILIESASSPGSEPLKEKYINDINGYRGVSNGWGSAEIMTTTLVRTRDRIVD
jgi:membrane protein insertase Oxa1/YidC/SpoIIIJ